MRPPALRRRRTRRGAPRLHLARAAAGRHSSRRARARSSPRAATLPHAVERDPFEVPLAGEGRRNASRPTRRWPARTSSFARRWCGRSESTSSPLTSEGHRGRAGADRVRRAGSTCAAARDGVFQMRSYPSAHVGSSCQMGWEYVDGLDLERRGAACRRAGSRPRARRRVPERRDDGRASTATRSRCRCTSRSAIRPSSTACTAPRPRTPARASSSPTTSARCATART